MSRVHAVRPEDGGGPSSLGGAGSLGEALSTGGVALGSSVVSPFAGFPTMPSVDMGCATGADGSPEVPSPPAGGDD